MPDRVKPPSNEMRGWTPALQDFVQAEQERRYRRLADALGLGSDPLAAYAELSNSRMLDDEQPYRVREQGYYQELSDEQFASINQFFNARVKPYYEAPLPTRYEHPDWYPTMVLIFDKVYDAMVRCNRDIDTQPLVATLPSGDVNARAIQEPMSDRSIIFFEHGLFKFIEDFASLIAWALPPISPQQMMNDRELARLGAGGQIPGQASTLFNGVFASYVVHGNPVYNRDWKNFPSPKHNVYLQVALGTGMEYFVMSHELSHLWLGHLAQTPSTTSEWRESELEADIEGAGMATVLMNEHLGPNANALSFWACYLMLTAMILLERLFGLFAFGTTDMNWISATHPDSLTRRKSLWATFAWAPDIPPESVIAAEHLRVLGDQIVQRLWQIAFEGFYSSYQRGTRPSPLWNDVIRSSLEPR